MFLKPGGETLTKSESEWWSQGDSIPFGTYTCAELFGWPEHLFASDDVDEAAQDWCADSVAGTPALGTLDHSHHRTCPSTWSPERRSPRRRSSPTASLRWRRSRKRRSRMTSMLSLSANVLFSDVYSSVAARATTTRYLVWFLWPPTGVSRA